MAVTRVTHSTAGFNAIDYALNGKPHVKDKYISGRVLTSSGVNCMVHGCRQQMNAVWKRYRINRPTRRNRRQVQRLIQSFDPGQLDYKKPGNVAKANAIGKKLAYRLYPHRQSIVATQADNQHHILHNHIITNMLDFRTGKSMTGRQTSWQHIQAISDSVIRNYGLNPTVHKVMDRTHQGQTIPYSAFHETDSEYHIKKRGKYSWVNDIRKRVHRALDQSASWNDLIHRCRQDGVTCAPYRKHKGGIRKDKNGKPVLKKYTSFSFTGKDKKIHHIRDKKLGTTFTHVFMNVDFQENSRHQQQAKEAHDRAIKQSISASVSSSASSASLSQSASASISTSISIAPISRRNHSASVGRSKTNANYSSTALLISQQSARSLSKAKNIAIQPKWTKLTSMFSKLMNEKTKVVANEKKRVISIMPHFHSRRAKRYASWYYGHAIPAYCVGYDGKIPEFSVNRKDRGLLYKMTSPIVKGFKHGRGWMIATWNGGKSALKNYINKHHIKATISWYQMPNGNLDFRHEYADSHHVTMPMDIVDMAREEKHSVIRGFVSKAKKFHNSWHNIKSAFNKKIIQPIKNQFNNDSKRAKSADLAHERALSARSEATSNAKASAANAITNAMKNRNRINSLIDSKSESMSISSYYQTPAGQSESTEKVAQSSYNASLTKSASASESASSSVSAPNRMSKAINSYRGERKSRIQSKKNYINRNTSSSDTPGSGDGIQPE